ncbi:SDR family NAD(P)-dependent oxidoreductase [Sorangium sp. So ce1335]|uniref:SDR family NAD(P)-dependent oxidoreductase n=1 Tax=Sorangium sp. So ce1335 TaxID=3133335 RepID=UPI003F5F5600
MKHAIVFGGTGAVGAAVLRALAARGATATFTYFRGADRAAALSRELGFRAVQLDLTDAAALRAFVARLGADEPAPAAAIHCAGALDPTPGLDLSDEAWDRAYASNARAAFLVARDVGALMARGGGGEIVLVGGLDRAQSLPIPVAFAASQGMIAATAMALAKELGPRQVRVNMVALGLLDAGLSAQLGADLRDEYLAFSALRRLGTPDEAARAIVWLALHNTYVSGKVVPVNGGI